MNYTAEDSWIAEATLEITLADLSPDKEPRSVEPSRRELPAGYALACSTVATGSAFIPHDPAIGLKARGRILGIHVGAARIWSTNTGKTVPGGRLHLKKKKKHVKPDKGRI